MPGLGGRGLNAGSLTIPASISSPPASQLLILTPTGATPASASTGGALAIRNTAADGVGLEVYSNHGSGATGRLVVFNSDNTAFDQNTLRVSHAGSVHGITIARTGFAAGQGLTPASELIDVTGGNFGTDADVMDTTLGISGYELTRGTIKVTHNQPTGGASNNDQNASAISINLQGATTKAQGIFIDTASGYSTGGKLLNIRVNSVDRLVLVHKGAAVGAASLLLFGASEDSTGQGVVAIPNAAVAPSAVANQGMLYVTAGSLHWRGPTTDTAIAPA